MGLTRGGDRNLMLLFPKTLNYRVSKQYFLSSRPCKWRRRIRCATPLDTVTWNLLAIGPSQIRNVAVFHANSMEGLRTWTVEGVGRSLRARYVEDGLYCGSRTAA